MIVSPLNHSLFAGVRDVVAAINRSASIAAPYQHGDVTVRAIFGATAADTVWIAEAAGRSTVGSLPQEALEKLRRRFP